jgi:16S rRNA (uracil1498-N3)-methyltransferase
VQVDRLQAHAVEAAEQCGGTFVPEVAGPVKFDALLDGWENGRSMMFCDESLSGTGGDLPETLRGASAILIGPEGGFSERERRRLAAREAAQAVSLGPRILRADTAAVAALTLWQRRFGDWS